MQKDLFWGGLIVGSSWINAIYLTNMRRLTNEGIEKTKIEIHRPCAYILHDL